MLFTQIHNYWILFQYRIGIFDISNYFIRNVVQSLILVGIALMLLTCIIVTFHWIIKCIFFFCDLNLKKYIDLQEIYKCNQLLDVHSSYYDKLNKFYFNTKKEQSVIRKKKIKKILIGASTIIFGWRLIAVGMDTYFGFENGGEVCAQIMAKRYIYGLVCNLIYAAVVLFVACYIYRRKLVNHGIVVK